MGNGRTDLHEKRNTIELIYTCMIAILFAIIFISIFVSSLTTTQMELSKLMETTRAQQRLVNKYCRFHHVSSEMVGSMKSQIALNKQRADTTRLTEQESQVIALLPQN